MKKLFFLMFISVCLSCSNDDDQQMNMDLNGEWGMTSYSTLAPGPELNPSDIIWEFNPSNNTLFVTNNIQEEAIIYGLSSGNYNTEIMPTIIKIGNTEYDYFIENQTLTIADDPESCGHVMVFTKQ